MKKLTFGEKFHIVKVAITWEIEMRLSALRDSQKANGPIKGTLLWCIPGWMGGVKYFKPVIINTKTNDVHVEKNHYRLAKWCYINGYLK